MWDDDEINKKIKDAADQYHPAYDENAWDKMALLLNEHLPVEKKKRRFLLIPIIVALVAGSFFVFYIRQNNSGTTTAKSNNVIAKDNIAVKSNTSAKNNTSTTSNIILKDNTAAIQLQQQKSLADKIVTNPVSSPNTVTAINSASTTTHKNIIAQQQNSANNTVDNANNKTPGNKENKRTVHTTSGKTTTSVIQGSVNSGTDINSNTVDNTPTKEQQQNDAAKDITSETSSIVADTNAVKKEVATAKKDTATIKQVTKKEDVKKPALKKKSTTSKSFSNNFAFDISVGPDVSSVNFNKTGRVVINYGAGVSYSLSARFTLRTGFYVSEKIYSANKNEYYIPIISPSANYLYKINANCKVYEIPLTVSYSFSKTKNHQWFASAGLSSYIMKKETYDYYYKYSSGNVDTKTWSVSNQNQNYFSVLDLSVGYEYSFNKRVSLLTEPYLKIPLSGIGAGKVKLNSGGVLFTLSVKPFYKK